LAVNLNPQNILATAGRLGGIDTLQDKAAVNSLAEKVGADIRANAAEMQTIRNVLVEAWTAKNDAAGLRPSKAACSPTAL
jgi:hypothetical protein